MFQFFFFKSFYVYQPFLKRILTNVVVLGTRSLKLEECRWLIRSMCNSHQGLEKNIVMASLSSMQKIRDRRTCIWLGDYQHSIPLPSEFEISAAEIWVLQVFVLRKKTIYWYRIELWLSSSWLLSYSISW